ncbi:MAG: class I SAM-dependent methyltransferase [bacterium]
METMVTTERRRDVTLTLPDDFLPVNDEYQPFRIIERRNFMQTKLEVPALVKTMKLPCNKRILEIGCGPGIALVPLAKLCKPARLVGIDIDDLLLKQAQSRLRENHIRVELYQEDVRNLPFPDESFDIVIDFGTCYHINRRVRALKEITRVLAPGGTFAYETPLVQLLAHPVRSFRKRVPWKLAPNLQPERAWILWASRTKR